MGSWPTDDAGFLLTGRDVREDLAEYDGDRPLFLETSRPGIFAVGDVRSGSIKRVASAVGEGSMAVRLVHERLAAPVAESTPLMRTMTRAYPPRAEVASKPQKKAQTMLIATPASASFDSHFTVRGHAFKLTKVGHHRLKSTSS